MLITVYNKVVRTHVCPWDWGKKDIYEDCTHTHTHTCIILFHYSWSYFISLCTVWMHCKNQHKLHVCISRQILGGHKHDMLTWWWFMMNLNVEFGIFSPLPVLPIFNLLPIISIFFPPLCPSPSSMWWLKLQIKCSAELSRLTHLVITTNYGTCFCTQYNSQTFKLSKYVSFCVCFIQTHWWHTPPRDGVIVSLCLPVLNGNLKLCWLYN